MIRPRLVALLASSVLALQAQTEQHCRSLQSDQITGRDLAAAIPAFTLIPPDTKLGYSPAPGVQRVFRPVQLQELAKHYNIDTKISAPVCFSWSLHLLSKQEVTTALRKSLAGHEVDLEILGQSQSLVPDGDLIFPLSGLTAGSTKPSVWNGHIAYAGSRRFNVWVQVQITLHEQQVAAVRPLGAGELIDPAALKEVNYSGPWRRSSALRRASEAIGKCARFPISAGTVLADSMVVQPQDVQKEQLVTVHTYCGAAHVETQGIAAEAGYRGDIIRVRNPKTGRIFRAKIDDRGVVTVVVDGFVGLVVEGKKS